MVLEMSQEEAKALILLIDAAVKAHGLQASESGLFLAKKIDKAMKEETLNPEKPEDAK